MFDRDDLFSYDPDVQECCTLGWREGTRPALPRPRQRSPRANASACCRPQQECRRPERDCGCGNTACECEPRRCNWEDRCRPSCPEISDTCGCPSNRPRNPCNLPRGGWRPICRPSCPPPPRPTWRRRDCSNDPDPIPPRPCPPPPQPCPLWIRKIDAETGEGLAGATFRLRGADESLQVETSRADGWLCFTICPCVRYVLAEIASPPGYEQSNRILEVIMDECGCLWVNGCVVECLCIPNVRLLQ